ncbi:MAG: hypothetical protein JSW72_07225 [Candidatus Bathyarchaeota archaeon]|nr:MAG: hypothetical protein JSW72_07225 [Candidatus Bathyarchaeota archaeon]
MREKKRGPQMLDEIEQKLETKNGLIDLEKLTDRISLKDRIQEMKMQEASKPLYLKRYE